MLQIGAGGRVPRVLVIAQIKPGPAIKGTFFDLRRVVERRVVAQTVALVDHAPRRSLARPQRDAAAIAKARRVNRAVAALQKTWAFSPCLALSRLALQSADKNSAAQHAQTDVHAHVLTLCQLDHLLQHRFEIAAVATRPRVERVKTEFGGQRDDCGFGLAVVSGDEDRRRARRLLIGRVRLQNGSENRIKSLDDAGVGKSARHRFARRISARNGQGHHVVGERVSHVHHDYARYRLRAAEFACHVRKRRKRRGQNDDIRPDDGLGGRGKTGVALEVGFKLAFNLSSSFGSREPKVNACCVKLAMSWPKAEPMLPVPIMVMFILMYPSCHLLHGDQ